MRTIIKQIASKKFLSIKIFLAIMALLIQKVDALHVELSNAWSDIKQSQKIYLRFVFEEQDEALFKDSITILLDNPEYSAVSWNFLTSPTTKYFTTLRTSKRVFTKTCIVQILLNSTISLDTSNPPNLFISGTCHTKQAKNIPFSLTIPLRQPMPMLDEKISLTTSTDLLHQISLCLTATSTYCAHIFYDVLNEEFIFLEALSSIWQQIEVIFHNFFSINFLYCWWYSMLWLVLSLLVLIRIFIRFYPSYISLPWLWEGVQCTSIIITLSSLPLMASISPSLPQKFFFIASTILVITTGIFCLITAHEKSFWGKIKGFIGLICVISAFPLITSIILFLLKY